MAQSTTTRPPEQQKPRWRLWRRRGTTTPLAGVTILALWQLRQTWRLLAVVGLGLLAAVVLVSAIPLYAQVAESAGLRHTLESDPQNLYVTVHAINQLFARDALNTAEQEITQELQNTLGSTIASQPDVSLQISTLLAGQSQYLRMVGTDARAAHADLTLDQGRLPALADHHVIEFAVTPTVLKNLRLRVGQFLRVPYNLLTSSNQEIEQRLTLRLVGVFTEHDNSAVFWHGETFLPETFSHGTQTTQRLPVLVDNAALMDALSALSTTSIRENSGELFANPSDIYWYYRFDFSHLDINHLANLTDSLRTVLTVFEHNPEFFPYIVDTTAACPLAIFLDYSDRVTVLGLPVLCLAFLIGGLVLLFVLLMTELLVKRQAETLSLLRGRGASVLQVAGSLFCQSLGPGLLALLLGPFLAILLVQVLAGLILQPADQAALKLITENRLGVALGLLGQDALVVGVAVAVMALSTWRVMPATRLNTRRERTRADQPPLWSRLNLDLLAAGIALLGFLITLYISGPGTMDVSTHALILPVTTLIGLFFLLLGGLLLFLRLFPLLLRLGGHLAARSRGGVPLLALVNLIRAPRQTLRMLLLLALAVAFAFFALIFGQTQSQRLPDLTAYRVGGDLSGDIPTLQQTLSWEQLLNWYRGLNGVTAVTLGSIQRMNGGNGGSGMGVAIDLRAVDASTYANVVYWTPADGEQSLAALTRELVAQRTLAEQQNTIPAIIDETAARSLNLKVGQQFILRDFHGPLDYRVVAIVHFIPTVYDSASSSSSDTFISHGGVLIDFQTASAVALALNQETLGPSHVWLRTSDSPAALTNVRHALLSGTYALDNPQDRRALDATLSSDPLYAALNGILLIGAAVILLLALLGNLMVSWLNARSRRGSFAVLRTLGGKPWQIVGVLLWEQGIVYANALILGTGLGLVFAWLLLPAFVFSPLAGVEIDNASIEAFYLAQSVPPVHPVFPFWPLIGLLAALILLCTLSLLLVAALTLRPQIRQTLRVDED